jgi:putative hydrolase of the HAD superfamily
MKGVAPTVFVDADNTLWDTDAVFARAQIQLLAEVEKVVGISSRAGDRLAFIRALDQQLAEHHHQGLRYPPRLLARAAALALAGFSASRAARSAWLGELKMPFGEEVAASVEQSFMAAISQPPELRPGVIEGLDRLLEGGSEVLIVTESAEAKATATADRLGLRGHFTRIIEGKKRPDLYKRVLRLTRSEGPAFMVGDQLDRDIAPAKEAGLATIYFPSGFKPKWMPDEAEVRPDFKIESFAEVPPIVAECLAKDRQRQAV